MTSSLVGSEMCIRDSLCGCLRRIHRRGTARLAARQATHARLGAGPKRRGCLLYTSDAADDM
eukprot:11033199-Prorocentrum_lima.AAC.1